MNNPSDIIKNVYIKNREGQVVASLVYDPLTKKISLDPVDVSLLTLRDFTRIHSFFRRVQGLRYNIMQGGQ